MTVTVKQRPGVWWTFNLKRYQLPLRGNWKLDGDGGAGVGPSAEALVVGFVKRIVHVGTTTSCILARTVPS